MASGNLKKAGLAVIVLTAVIAGAFILGTEAGNFYNEKRYLENRDNATTSILSEMRTLEIGGKLEDHTFENLDGTDMRLSDMITDRTIICFFSVDCGSCLFELEEMQATLKGSLHHHVILISHDDRVSLQETRAAYNIESPILWDQNGFYARNLNIQVRPFNVMIDSTLTIRKIVAGKLNGSEFHEFISE